MERRISVKKILSLVLVALLTVSVFGVAQAVQEEKAKTKEKAETKEAPVHQYVGVTKCAMCHKSKARGDQYGQWEKTKHSQAYAMLATDVAKEAGKKAGLEGDPQKSPKCLKCHVTAYGADKSLLGAKYSMEEGVTCEACHGPGSDYMKLSIMKNKEEAIANGLVMPTEEVCVKCHNKESPTFTKFDFKEMYPKIAHPIPKEEQK
jgi:hypothetical protein